MKKKISIFLILILLINQFTIAITYDGDKSRNLSWTDYTTLNSIDTNLVPEKNSDGLLFNRELYEEKGLIVYGDHGFIIDNDFKDETLNASGQGYYIKNSVYGEYRYHGFTVNGAKITNDDFPRDSDSGRSLEQKTWVYNPWDEFSYANRQYQNVTGTSDEPIFSQNINTFQILGMHEEVYKLKKQVNEGIPFDMTATDVTYTFTGSDVITNRDASEYVAVEVAPGTLFSGQGVMFHKSPYGESANGAWYQTMSIESTNDKVEVPVTATITSYKYSINEDAQTVTVFVTVKGEIEDDFVYVGTEQEVDNQKQVYFNREDIYYWEMKITNTLTNDPQTVRGYITSSDKKTGQGEMQFNLPYAEYEALLNEDNVFDLTVNATATAVLYAVDDTPQANNIRLSGYTFDNTQAEGGAMEEEPLPITLDVEIDAAKEMLDIDQFNVSYTENDMSGILDRYVSIDGQILSEEDELKFLNGQYKFPKIRQSKVYNWRLTFIDYEGEEYTRSSFVLVYDSVPHASTEVDSYYKENRLNTITGDFSPTANYVKGRIPGISVSVSVDKTEGVVYQLNSSSTKEFIVKQPDFLTITTVVANNLPGDDYGQRTYTNYLYIGEDLRPDIVANIWNPNLARNDSLDIACEGVSLDGDNIQSFTYEIFFDEDQDGIAEKSVYSEDWGGETDYTPTQLGYYEIVWKIKESFGEPTIASEITEDDYRTFELTREFTVDNLLPMTKIYTDIEYNFPSLEVVLVLDENLPEADATAIKNNAVAIQNLFRKNSMVAQVDIFDTKTYIYDAPASYTSSYRTSYPASTYNYSNNGYTNPALPRVSVSTSTRYRDDSYYTTETETKSATKYIDNTSGGTSVYRWSGDNWDQIVPWNTTQLPSTTSYNSGGWSGTLNKTGAINKSDPAPSGEGYVGEKYYRDFHWVGVYTGTVSREVQVYHNVQTPYTVYRGNYSGTAYKAIKQNYVPNLETDTNKYLIFVTNNTMSNVSLLDFKNVKNIAKDAELYGISDNIMNISGLGDVGDVTTFIPYDADVLKSIESVVLNIKDRNPILNELTLLQNEAFVLSFTDYDPEGDPLLNATPMQYVHDSNYFDNPTGQEPGTYAIYDDGQFTSSMKTSFLNVGEYTIIRKISDEPVSDPTQGLDSNLAELKLYVHRKPIADYDLDWTFDPNLGTYQTTWLDTSYDLDFEFSDPINKGIVDRKIKYRRNGGSWIYEIPNDLVPGTYDLEYVVQDNFGVWSDPKTQSFVLSAAPPVQILNANLKAYIDSKFDLTSIPASEDIEFYDVETRYPYDSHLAFGIYNTSGGLITSQVLKNFNSGVDTKVDQDIFWSDTVYNIPSTLPDGNYRARVYLIADASPTNYMYEEFNFTVDTPVDLNPSINGMSIDAEMYLDEDNTVQAETSIYVDSVNVNVIGQNLTMVEVSNDGYKKVWETTVYTPEALGERSWNATFTAETTNGNSEIEVLPFETKIALEITGTVTPNPCLAGELITFTFDTKGAAQRVILNLENIETGNITELTSTLPIATRENEWILEYIVPLDTNDGVYRVTATAIKDTRNAQVDLDITVDGNILDLVKPSDKEGN